MDDSGLKIKMLEEQKKRIAKKGVIKNFINEIIPNLFLGDLQGALANKDEFDVIINLSTYDYKAIGVMYVIKIDDHPSVEIISFVETCNLIIESALKENKKVLVHCLMGKSRSASIVLGYLMTTNKISFEEASEIINKQRTHPIEPNIGFMYQLKKFIK